MSASSKNLDKPPDPNPSSPPAGRGRLIIRNTLSSASSVIFAQLLAPVTFPFLLRQAGTTDYGIYALAASSLGYFSILNLTARPSVVKYTAELPQSDHEFLNWLISNALLINSFLGIKINLSMILR